MGNVRDYSKLARDIICEVGGEDNIVNATRCATRLRLVLKSTPASAKEKISSMPGVITVVENNGQFQVVIGTHVSDVFEVVSSELHLDENGKDVQAPKQGIVNRIVATMSAVFAPFVYILAAAGLLQGILILINMAYPEFAATGTYEVLSFMSWTPFTFLPIFIAITASKHFKCNTFIAVLCCCALVNPSLTEIAARVAEGDIVTFLGLPLSETTYTSTVLPPLFLVWVLSYVERFLEKRLPDLAKPLLTPLICFVVMVPATVLLIGPASAISANAIADGYNFLVSAAPAVAGAIIGGFWQVIVIFGVHWGITPVVLANFDMNGFDTFQVFQTAAVVGQMAAAFGVFLKSRNKKFKGVALSAGITAIFGITEPTIYGVSLRLKKPFVCGCIGGAAGAIVISLFHSAHYAYAALPGLLTVVNAYSPEAPMSLIGLIAGCAVTIVVTIVLIQIIGFDDPKNDDEDEEVQKLADTNNMETKKATANIISPVKGTVIPLTEVKDEVFSGGLMGLGCGINPAEGKIYAPFDGKIVGLLESNHAIGMESEDGVEILIHVGMDTVKLNGKYFTCHVKEGESVKQGQLLLEFNIEEIQKEGFDVITPVVITNSDEFSEVTPTLYGKIEQGETLLHIKRV